jgi:hypothetical protein
MATRFTNPTPQFFYNGTPAAPLSGGLMYFYEPGSSLVPKDTYADNALTIENSNPVVLTSSGSLSKENVFLDGAYRVILKDKNGVQQWDRDNVNSIVQVAFDNWNAQLDYGIGGANVVYATDGIYYVSIDTPNIGHDPAAGASPTFWQPLPEFMDIFATNAETNTGTATDKAVTPASLAQYPGLTAIRRNQIDGFITSNAADADHDITVGAGACADSTNTVTIQLVSAMTKQIDATWVAGTGAGGLAATLTVGNNTWYHLFAVVVAGNVDVMFDTSVTCATGVANNAVTAFRRIGSVLTNSSANIIAYFQQGDCFYWNVPVRDFSTGDPGTSAVTATLSVPLGVVTRINSTLVVDANASEVLPFVLVTSLSQTDTVPSATIFTLKTTGTVSSTSGIVIPQIPVVTMTNTSSQIRYRCSLSGANLYVAMMTYGWEDFRGKQ